MRVVEIQTPLQTDNRGRGMGKLRCHFDQLIWFGRVFGVIDADNIALANGSAKFIARGLVCTVPLGISIMRIQLGRGVFVNTRLVCGSLCSSNKITSKCDRGYSSILIRSIKRSAIFVSRKSGAITEMRGQSMAVVSMAGTAAAGAGVSNSAVFKRIDRVKPKMAQATNA